MRVLTACECSGRVRDAFGALGHDAWSADIKPSENGGQHIEGNVLPLLAEPWDLVIAFPPCTDLSSVNAGKLEAKIADGRSRAAADFFMACYDANSPRVCVENPQGLMSRWFRKPDQYVHPWMWSGEDSWHTKRTGLWLRGLPPLLPDYSPPPRGARPPSWVDAMHAGAGPYKERATRRSRTFLGVANAMAAQWGVE